MTNEEFQFHMEQYKLVRQELSERQKERQVMELYALGAIGAIYAWFGSQASGSPLSQYAAAALVSIPVLVCINALNTRAGIMRLASYCRLIEEKMGGSDLPGWETFRSSIRGKTLLKYPTSTITVSIWIVVFAISLVFAVRAWSLPFKCV